MAYVYTALTTPQNTKGGLAEYALIALVEWFTPSTGIKCPVAPFNALGDVSNVVAAHTFTVDKGFLRFGLASEKNLMEATEIGDVGFKQFDFKATIVVPGSYKELHNTIGDFLNKPVIALIKDANCSANFFYQLGCDCTYARLGATFRTGTTKEGVKGYEVNITWQNDYVLTHTPVAAPTEYTDVTP